MNFRLGATRFVVLVGNVAIKFPRLRPLRPFVRLLEILRKKEGVRDNLEKYDKSIVIATLQYLFSGVVTNYWEHRFYKENSNISILVPTYYSFFGLLNVQKRGKPIDDSSRSKWETVQAKLADKGLLPHDLFEEKNCCTIDGKIQLFDYGDAWARKLLVCRKIKQLERQFVL